MLIISKLILLDRPLLWLIIALGFNLFICIVTAMSLIVAGEAVKDGINATALISFREIQRTNTGLDSWIPMIKAYKNHSEGSTIYSVFFKDKIKFQYPPSSLFLLNLFPSDLLNLEDEKKREQLRSTVGKLSIACLLFTIIISVLILEVGIYQYKNGISFKENKGLKFIPLRIIFCLMIGFTFYPLIKAHSLGQIQIYLNLLAALAIFFLILNRHVLSGICIGLCCLVKPQFGLILLWSLFRRHWHFMFSMLSIIIIGFGLSILNFGWHNHIEYLEVLRTISKHGETFWPNQTINGIMNRFLLTSDPVVWNSHQYAPYNVIVYYTTLISSLFILLVAFRQYRDSKRTANLILIDFMIILLAATIASPIAWEHHYGIIIPISAALLPILLYVSPFGRWTAPLFAIGFSATANVLLRPTLIFDNRWVGILGSHLFFGGIIIMILMLAARSYLANYSRQPL